jgi:hypothetical protein
MGQLWRTKRHTATGKQNQVLVAAVNRHMPATPAAPGFVAAFDCLPHRLEQRSLAQSDEVGRVGGFEVGVASLAEA